MIGLLPLRMSIQQASRVLSSSIFRNRPISSHSFQYRGYVKEQNYKDGRLTRGILEEEETLGSRSLRNYIVPTTLIVLAGAAAFLHYNDEKRAIPKGSERSTGIGKADTNKPAIGGPFKLLDTENHVVTESELRGNWILLYFGYTSSPDVGPAEVDKMVKVISILESQHNLQIKPVYITVDPQRDTSDQLRAYLGEYDSRITGLTGPSAAVRQIAHEYRVFFRKVDEDGQDYLVDCSHNMYLLDPNMDTLRWFGTEYNASQLADAIVREVTKSSR